MSNPMEQFVVKPIIPIKVGDIDISFTNSSLFMVLAVVLSTLIFAFCLRRRSIIPSVSQSIPESYDENICRLVGQIVNVSVDEATLTDGKVDVAKVAPITFDPFNNEYYVLGEKVDNAFSDGKAIK